MPVNKGIKVEPELPMIMRWHLKHCDAEGAVCGSVTNCTLAQSGTRWLREQGHIPADAVAPKDFYIKIRPNRVSITLGCVYHYYDMPDKALKVVRQTDAGQCELIRETTLVFHLVRTERRADPLTWRSPERRAQVLAAKAARKADGHTDKRYPNERIEAARRAGMKGKKLGATQPAAA